ncbi:Tetratricopeptide repeat family protein [Stigmatella aurantiaca DW4/3-1]|uniref:Tetratricopeptide repeat family protein n=1 Tax=Stigmatella aurantiaca (strain DW4/3-1) TaxID=378806 RepID=E3FHE8_STIAD|nr:Tetratricopeptide repeat family protein [Stigmatella aurantiaca DW4/3-1]
MRLVEAKADYDEGLRLKDAGKYAEALTRVENALTLREAALGGMHPGVAQCLNTMGNIHRRQGNLAQAEPLHQRALAILEAVFGPGHPNTASSLNSLATLYKEQGLHGRAESLYQSAIVIYEKAYGKSHPHLANTLNNLANLYVKQGLYGRAEPLHQRALAIREELFGKTDPRVAASLTNLAFLYSEQGLYSRAEPLYQRALVICEETLGKNHHDTASLLNNLALLYSTQGLHGRAEPLYLRAISIYEKALGEHHPSVATALGNLANLYIAQGLYGRAEPLYLRAISLQEAVVGKNHPDVATLLNNLATNYFSQGLYGQAEALHQRALAIREATLGKNHPHVASSLDNLATVYTARGTYRQAEALHQRALAIREAALGKMHPKVAETLNNFAGLYKDWGLYDRAEPLFLRALAIRQAVFGPNHHEVALTLYNLGELRLAQHRLADALPFLTRAFSASEQRLRHEALDFSDARLSSFLQYLRVYEQTLYTVARTHARNAQVRRLALSAVLLLKGRSASETAHISRTLFRHMGAEDRNAFERLRGLRHQLAALSFADAGELTAEDFQQRLKALVEEGDSLEAELAKRSAPLRSLTALPPPTEIVDRVAASLPKDGALVELIAYKDRLLGSKPGSPSRKVASEERYLALVLFPDASTRVVDLGPAEPIDRAATRLREALAEREASFQATAQELYRLVFQPVWRMLGPTRRLFLSPDGQLNLIPFAALHDGQDFLLDAFDITYLSAGRELLRPSRENAPSSSVFVIADPEFTASFTPSPSPSSAASPPSETLERFFSTPRPELTRSAWVPLPGTRLEAQSIQHLLPQAQLFLGSEATKDRLLHLPTPGILHVATHGFFLGDAPAALGFRGPAFVDSLGGAPPPQQEPLLNSGLVLAGAHIKTSDTTPPSLDETLVTALELAGLDLWSTQLVVLSACDTGRGDVHLGQGVYGLRRSLVAAGAETVVVSLWKVSDGSTHLLMDTYYRNLLAGQGRSSALREAMRSLRASHPHPHAWAPFIALGSDAPLYAITPKGLNQEAPP